MKNKYPFNIRQLSDEEGGGYLIEFPDLPGCMSDGRTIDEAVANGSDAVATWIETAKQTNRQIPKPGELESQSGKWVQRVPKSIHLRLVNRAKAEGVSLNTLVITMLSESLGESKQSTLRHKVNDASEGKTYKEKSTISKSKITNKK
jgi:antitoxin HicB